MSNDLRFQRTARAWLELGPIEAPADVIQAAFLEIDTTPQERDLGVPWRFRPMPTLARALVAAAVFGLVAGGALILQSSAVLQVGKESPSPVVPSPAPSASGLGAIDLSSTFVSSRYGYSLPINAAWATTQASLTWTGPDNTSPVTDDISVPGTDIFFNGASQAFAAGQGLSGWLDVFQPPDIASLSCWGGSASEWPTIEIGAYAWRWEQACVSATAVTEAGGHAYVFTCGGCEPPSDPSTGRVASEAVNQTNQLFVRMLSAVQLQPDAVPSPSPAPPLGSEYRSDEHGYTLNYPYGWALLQRATAPGPVDRMPVPQNPSIDALGDGSLRFSVTSVPLAKGESALEWTRAFCEFGRTQWSMPCDQGPAVWEAVPLANGTAWLTVNGDSAAQFPQPDSRLFLATAVSGGRAYEFRLEGPAERALFLAILASIRLDPAAAAKGTPAP